VCVSVCVSVCECVCVCVCVCKCVCVCNKREQHAQNAQCALCPRSESVFHFLLPPSLPANTRINQALTRRTCHAALFMGSQAQADRIKICPHLHPHPQTHNTPHTHTHTYAHTQTRTLLSSSTVFRFSIQIASTGPSKTIHVFWFLFLAARRHSTAKMPSVQSPVAASMRPNIWGAVIPCKDAITAHTFLVQWVLMPVMGTPSHTPTHTQLP